MNIINYIVRPYRVVVVLTNSVIEKIIKIKIILYMVLRYINTLK